MGLTITTALASVPPAVAARRNYVDAHHRHGDNGNRHQTPAVFRSRHAVWLVHAGVVPLANAVWDNPPMSQSVANAIRTAASDTGLEPHLLAAIAWRESRFDPKARNHLSSATGLLQFTNSTWLRAVQRFGARHNAAVYAEQIKKDLAGVLRVPDRRARAAIMQLRSNPAFSAALAAEVICAERDAMAARLGRELATSDMYLLHVLGTGGSTRFLQALATHPTLSSQSVASRRILRQAGLLARDGRPMTIGNTYAALEVMLADQRRHSELLLAAPVPVPAIEVGRAP